MGFWAVAGPIISAIAPALIGGRASASSVADTNAANAEQAQLNRDWQSTQNQKAMDFSADQANIARSWEEYMSNSAYQRSMLDLKSAGLNPMLSLMKGGASSPNSPSPSGVTSGGAQATMQPAGLAGIQTAMSVAEKLADLGIKEAQKKNIDMDTRAKDAQIGATNSQSSLFHAQKQKIINEVADIIPMEKARLMWDAMVKQAQYDTETQRYYLTYHQAEEMAKRVGLTHHESEKIKWQLPRIVREAQMYESKAGGLIPWLGPLKDATEIGSGVLKSISPWGLVNPKGPQIPQRQFRVPRRR